MVKIIGTAVIAAAMMVALPAFAKDKAGDMACCAKKRVQSAIVRESGKSESDRGSEEQDPKQHLNALPLASASAI